MMRTDLYVILTRFVGGGNLEVEYFHFESKTLGKRRKGYSELLIYANEHRIDTILCTKLYLDVAVKLLWQADYVDRYFVNGCENPYEPEKNDSRVQTLLWDNIASKVEKDSISQSGWVSSITGNPFSMQEMEEYGQNITTKLEKWLNNKETIVEIGVASGLTLFKIAPRVNKYYGIDISEETLKRTNTEIQRRKLRNTFLLNREADEIDSLKLDNIDIGIINSVCQYFPGYNYFYTVIGKLISMIKDSGIIFVGDMLDWDKKACFETELMEYGRKSNQRDLWYPRNIFEQLTTIFPEIVNVEITDKIGTIQNELKKYRYDCIIIINKNNADRVDNTKKTKYVYSIDAKDITQLAKDYYDKKLLEVIGCHV